VRTTAEEDGDGWCVNDGCCGDGAVGSEQAGYGAEGLAAVEGGADLGLGCGNPKTVAELAPGETVPDLGPGAGFDCFLAAREIGDAGRVAGVDMTPEMGSKGRDNVPKNDASNVEFRPGGIEHLPVADASVDVVISNCVVDLSPEKQRVFDETFRMLRPGGRLAMSDVVRTAAFPPDVHTDPGSLAACVAGASTVDAPESMLADAGFEAVGIAPKDESDEFIGEWDDERDLSEHLVSTAIEAVKPAGDVA
jgi:SAM-dependent methyltransferase